MSRIEQFHQATVKAKLTLDLDEKLSCAFCGGWTEDSCEIWIYVDNTTGVANTCCIPCSQIDPNPDPFETDAA